ncbi:MAG: phosphate--AMP phosphotransferase [Tissierellia bacterium]|nr:phosphate--AMP phosphotransferase [Tissierellia bacterium]
MLFEFDYDKYNYEYSECDKSELMKEFGLLQRKIKELGIPVLIMLEGWECSGKGYVINDLVREVNHKYTKVHVFSEMTEEEREKPFLWRFWNCIPAKGEIAVFDRSFYYDLMDDLNLTKKKTAKYIEDIESIEKQLRDDDTVIIKIFLNISEQTQKNRIQEYETHKYKKILVNERDYRQNRSYDEYLKHFNQVLKDTDFKGSRWNIIPSESMKKASLEVLGNCIDILKKSILKHLEFGSVVDKEELLFPESKKIIEELDYDLSLSHKEYKKIKKDLEPKLNSLGYEFFVKKVPSILIFEGVDAAGKGGAIKRLTKCFDPRGYEVVPISAPSDVENSYHYMWRFWKEIPPNGKMTIFDRSWYGRVLVERIEGFATEEQWKRAYNEINEIEKHLRKSGVLILKFFIAIDNDEQLRRFNDRMLNPDKNYKLTEEDWRNREKWDSYLSAYDDMIERTSTEYAPWIVIPGNDKYYARIRVLEEVLKRGLKFIEDER